jgi:sulfide:quinone oxidoreductase
MADLQAAAAAKNIIAEFNGKPANATFKVELMCIIDTNEKGMLVYRSEKRSIMLPSCRVHHWLKRSFEWWYLRKYR